MRVVVTKSPAVFPFEHVPLLTVTITNPQHTPLASTGTKTASHICGEDTVTSRFIFTRSDRVRFLCCRHDYGSDVVCHTSIDGVLSTSQLTGCFVHQSIDDVPVLIYGIWSSIEAISHN